MQFQVLFFRLACLLGALSVGLGAFAAHGLKARLTPELLQTFKTGVLYQFIHTLALLALALAPPSWWSSHWTPAAASCWLAGILLFSGSLYGLALGGPKILGPITPLGGLAFIIGWLLLLGAAKTQG